MTAQQAESKNPIDILFRSKISAALIVDFGARLSLCNIELKGDVRVTAYKVLDFLGPQKEELVSFALREFVKEHKIQHRNAFMSFSSGSFFIKHVKLPAVPDAELLEAARWKIKEEAPFDLSKAVFEVEVIERGEKEAGVKTVDLICAAALEADTNKYAALLKAEGFSVLKAAFSPFGYAKIIGKFLQADTKECLALLDIGRESSFLGVYRFGKLEFYRELPFSANKLKDSLRGALISERGKVELTPEEAEEVLFRYGVPVTDFVYNDKISSLQILSMIRPSLERLAQEIKRSIAYYSAQFQGGTVNRIVLAGEALKIPHMGEFLGKETSLAAVLLPVVDKIKAVAGISEQDILTAYGFIGTAIDYESGINLLPREFRTEKSERFQKTSLWWAAFIGCLFLLVTFIFAKAGVSSYQKRLANALFEFNSLSEIKQMKDKIDAFSGLEVEIKNSGVPLGVIFKKISASAPADLFLENLLFDAEARTGSMKGFVKISVSTDPNLVLTAFTKVMNDSGYFNQIKITKLTRTLNQGGDVIVFEVHFGL